MSDDKKPARQLDLFGTAPAPSRRSAVAPAEIDDELAEVAARLPANVRLGTSSWSFPGWEGIVYDRAASKAVLARQGLAAYARHPLLRAVGIDRTFYAPLPATEFAAYAEAVPDDFRFLVKAAGLCTMPLLRDGSGRLSEPNPHFLDAGFAAAEVVAPMREGLGDKAGPLVFQFPPLGRRFGADPDGFAERLEAFLGELPAGPLYAVELRDRELFGGAYLDALERSGARHCFNVHPRMPPIAEQWRAAGARAAGPLVARWMLHSGLRYEEAVARYEPFSALVDEDEPSRAALAGICLEEALRTRMIVIVANNKAEGSAPLTLIGLAREIVRRLASRPGPR